MSNPTRPRPSFAATRLCRVVFACMALTISQSIARAQAGRPDFAIDAAARADAVTNLAREVETHYPVATTASRVASDLRAGLRKGRYTQTSARQLATTLTQDLRRLSGDQHFFVDYFVVPRTFPAVTETQDPVSEADRILTFRLQNFGFARVERLAGNIGYLKLDHFEAPSAAGETAAAAMRFIAGTDALIIDLRDNGGGHLAMVTLMASYFFSETIHLNDRMGRDPASLKQSWTYAAVPGPRYIDKPVYILSGPRTFSAAEGFAYDMQSQRRARIVGETTRGGANTAARMLLSPRFGVIMPIGRVVNTVTAGNWEGGLKPDTRTSAARAFPTAHLAALEAVAAQHRDDPLTEEIGKAIASLKAELAVPFPRR